MARRVGLAVIVVLLAAYPRPASGAGAARAGIAHALLGRWDASLGVLEATERPGRSIRYFRAVALWGVGLRQASLSELKELSDTEGAFAGPALELGIARLFEAEHFDTVVEWAQSSKATRFMDPDTFHYRVGQSYVVLGRTEEAQPYLEKVSAGSTQAYAQHALGLVYFSQRRLQRAVAALGSGVDAANSHPDPVIASALADRIRLSRGRVIYQLAVEGTSLGEAERKTLFALASAQFSRVALTSPLYAKALRGAGWCALELGEPAQALAAFGSAANLDPGRSHEDLWAQGRVYQRQGYPDEAARAHGEARRTALAEAEQLEKGRRDPAPTTTIRRWRAVLEQIEDARRRSTALADEIEPVAAANRGMELRLAATGRALERARATARSLTGELDALAANLKSYLDRIPASKLFPRGEQQRLQNLLARRDRMQLQTARIEAALVELGQSRLWSSARPELRGRAERLWQRLGTTRVRLAGAQIAFLEALKRRVSAREAELIQTIADLRSKARDLDVPSEEGKLGLTRARQDLAESQTRLTALNRRRADLLTRLEALATEATTHAEAAKGAAAKAEAAKLRLRADAYALDETEALHLWQEGEQRPDSGRRK